MERTKKLHKLVEGAIMVSLATVLSFAKIIQWPFGGSITLLSMLPIIFFSIRYGVLDGLKVSFAYSLIQMVLGIAIDGIFAWGLTPWTLVGCLLFDYILAFSVLSLGGLFRKKGLKGYIGGLSLAIGLRFVCHYISGVVIFKSFGELWEGVVINNTWAYSLVYNGSFMLPELVITLIGAIILFKTPQVKKMLKDEESQK